MLHILCVFITLIKVFWDKWDNLICILTSDKCTNLIKICQIWTASNFPHADSVTLVSGVLMTSLL